MISYGNPVCAISNSRASLFCCKAYCTKPAFACTENCLFEEGHFDKGALHSIMPWRAIEEPIRLAMEPTLSMQELQHLENQ
jgi:hypothetical protein